MNKVEASKIAKGLFKSYPTVDTFHCTEDGQAFEKVQDAFAHAQTINKKDPVVFPISRDGQEEMEPIKVPVNTPDIEPVIPVELTEEENQKVKAAVNADAIEQLKLTETAKAPAADVEAKAKAEKIAADKKAASLAKGAETKAINAAAKAKGKK